MRLRGDAGLTLAETLVAFALTAVLMALLADMYFRGLALQAQTTTGSLLVSRTQGVLAELVDGVPRGPGGLRTAASAAADPSGACLQYAEPDGSVVVYYQSGDTLYRLAGQDASCQAPSGGNAVLQPVVTFRASVKPGAGGGSSLVEVTLEARETARPGSSPDVRLRTAVLLRNASGG